MYWIANDQVIDALLQALHEPFYWSVTKTAAWALGELGCTEQRVLDALVAALSDPYFGLRQSAAAALGTLGVNQEPIVTALRKATQDPDISVRHWAGYALQRLEGGPNSTVEQAIPGDVIHSLVEPLAARAVAHINLPLRIERESVDDRR
jgi:HEAT repeats